jgi:long-chain acyl-CoA synthetase
MELPPTLVHLLRARSRELGDAPALWSKREGTWVPTSWRSYGALTDRFARGLIALGLQPHEPVGIIGFNQLAWHVAAYGSMAAGAVPVGIYITSSPEQVAHVLGHCDARVVVVEDEAQLAKVQAIRHGLPRLSEVVLMRGTAEGARSLEEVLALGDGVEVAAGDARVAALAPDDLATLIYTSGTTGPPKGVELTHRNLVWTAAHLSRGVGVPEGAVLLSYLPLSHIAEQLISMHCGIWNSLQVYFAESMEKLPENLREVRPTIFLGVPRVWEKFKARIEDGLTQTSPRKRKLLERARAVATTFQRKELEGQKVEPWLALRHALFRRLVFRPLHARLGLDRAQILGTSAAPIGGDVLAFFLSLDLVLQESYGQSEVTGPTSLNVPGATRLGTLGRPMIGVEVRIDADGEILVRGENLCRGYHRDPEATAALIQDGWLHSGDVGELDPDGYLRITDRKKDLIVTSGGKKASPQELEKLLRAIPLVGQAVVVGERRNFLCALLTLEPDAARRFGREHGLDSTSIEELGRLPAMRESLQRGIDEVNARLSRWETIKRFEILPNELTVEGGELTPTLKVKRAAVGTKYASTIERLYAE